MLSFLLLLLLSNSFASSQQITIQNNTVEIKLTAHKNFYGITLEVGSSNDPNFVLLDTGSSDLWFKESSDNCYSDNTGGSFYDCIKYGFFNPKYSETSKIYSDLSDSEHHLDLKKGNGDDYQGNDENVNEDENRDEVDHGVERFKKMVNKKKKKQGEFLVRYGTGVDYAKGAWVDDNVVLSEKSFDITGDQDPNFQNTETAAENTIFLKLQRFGVADDTPLEFGILGVGFPESERSDKKYDNFPVKLKKMGYINKTMYSIALNDQNGEASILFGGLDESKFDGELSLMPSARKDAGLFSLGPHLVQITLNGLVLKQDLNTQVFKSDSYLGNDKYPALLDTGSTRTHFPEDILETVFRDIDVKRTPETKYAEIDCLRSEQYSLEFNFQGKIIEVPIKNFVQKFENNDTCGLALLPSNDLMDSTFLLGSDFLKSVYLTVDMEEKMIGLADIKRAQAPIQYLVEATSNSIIPVGKGKIDYGKKVCGYRRSAYDTSLLNTFTFWDDKGSDCGINSSAIIVSRPSFQFLLIALLCVFCIS